MNRARYRHALKRVRDTVPSGKWSDYDMMFARRRKSPVTALVLGFCLGSFGIARFYIGSIRLGVLKLLTFGLCGIFTFIDWFLIMGAARDANVALAGKIKRRIGR